MEDEEFAKFSTDLGFAMEVIKHQSSDADPYTIMFFHENFVEFGLNFCYTLLVSLCHLGG